MAERNVMLNLFLNEFIRRVRHLLKGVTEVKSILLVSFYDTCFITAKDNFHVALV